MRTRPHICALAAVAVIVLIACAPATLLAQHASKAVQTVTFAVVPVHTPAAAQYAVTRGSEKVTIGPSGGSATAVDSTLPAAVNFVRRRAARNPRGKPSPGLYITITE